MSDFDIMLARRKAMNSKRRRHRDAGTFINDSDDVVSAMITKMNEAAEVGIFTAARSTAASSDVCLMDRRIVYWTATRNQR